jgi:hypothetical protein
MFRRLPASLPVDPVFYSDLGKLGYFINDDGQIRQIKRPDQPFLYKITTDERYNEMQREAINSESLSKHSRASINRA